MKRCPQCEFIYEDDQSLCDMDGVLLVFDSRTLPNLHALAPVEAPFVATTSKGHWRHRTFPAMAALILATVLSLVYFVSTQRTVPAPAAVTGASIAIPPSELPKPTTDANQAVPPPVAEDNASAVSEPAKEETKTDSHDSHKATSTAPTATKKASSKTTERKPSEETKKDDSKVGSILKKTGRILKKPFKF